MQKVFINVARGHHSFPLSSSRHLSACILCPLLLAGPAGPTLSVCYSLRTLATCSRQRLINGLQAQARIPGSFLMDSGNSTGNNAGMLVSRGESDEDEQIGWTKRWEQDRLGLVGWKRGGERWGGTESRGHVKLANNLNSPFKSWLCLCERK